MAIFRYEAADVNGKLMRGAMDAASAQEVSQRLAQRGYVQVHVLAHAAGAMANATANSASTVAAPSLGVRSSGNVHRQGIAWQTARSEDVALFFRQMASLVHSGYTVGAALSDLAMRTGNRAMRSATAAMANATTNGSALAPVMARYPGLFAEHVVGLVAAGEAGGFVEFAFEEAALGAEQDAALKQGMWWPKLLIWNTVWTVLLMQPLFPGIDAAKLSKGNGDIGSIIGAVSGYAHALPYAIGLGIAIHIASWLIGKMRHQPFAERAFDSVSLRIPVMARLAKMRGMAAFTRVLRRLLQSGISPEPAFAGAIEAVPNALLRERLRYGIPIMRGGQGIDAAIQATGLMAHDPLQMLVTGQKTGQWIEMLDRVTAHYQEEAARATEGARAAQKRLGVILTIIVTGYVICVTTWGGYKLVFQYVDAFSK